MRNKKKLVLIFVAILVVACGLYLFVFHSKSDAPPVNNQTKNAQNTTKTETIEPVAFNKSANSLTDPASIWVVVNKQRPLNPKEYVPADLTTVGSQSLRAEAAAALTSLISDANAQGLTISALSGYRSYSKQVTVYGNEVATNGQAVADSQSARPGYSEHQTGWAIDVGGGGCGIEDCFGTTEEGKWVAANAYKYGFIIRYIPDKVAITGYRAEPWHLRYIGKDLSNEMKKQNVETLEEFFGLPAAPTY